MLEALARANFERDVGRINPRSARLLGWSILEAAFPILDIAFAHATEAGLRLRLTCTDWDELPPKIDLLSLDGSYLTAPPPHGGNVINPGPHDSTGRPFVCMRGAREYHTHPSHLTDLWDNYRGQLGMDLGGIVQQLHRAWKRSVG